MYRIQKSIDFCYGHRVWTQQLIEEYCDRGDTSCKCKHLHGHQGRVTIEMVSDELQHGMVTDFKHVGWLKNFIDSFVDHKFIIDRNDPQINRIVNGYDSSYLQCVSIEKESSHERFVTSKILDPSLPGFDDEYHGGFLFVEFVPTSENLCKWIYTIAEWKMKGLATIRMVEWQETPKSKAIYIGEDHV